MNDPSACREILRGVGTPFETARARGLSRQNLQSQLASMLVGGFIVVNAIMEDYNALVRREEETIRLRAQAESMMKTAQAAEMHLEKERAAFEKLKQTERWAASADLEQVRSLAKLLTEERKLWKEACARENEKLFRLHPVLNNLKATNAALVKEKTTTEAAVKEAEAHGAAMLRRSLQMRMLIAPGIHGEVTSRATEAETRARQAEGVRDGLATSLAQVTDDHAWMRQHGIGHIVEAILDAPENAVAVTDMNERAYWAGFKAGYNKCLNDVNPFCGSKFTDERSGFHGVDTEAAFDAAVDAYNKLSIPSLDRIETCLEAEDYVDHLHMLFNPVKEGEGTGGAYAE
ncbi:hypothetical protein HanRHA438_Chr06g0275501 [Helianthus annuus]|uniref:Uncharacterized protein n=1 Tax=Helianthus annuus TaxID=4232 RepID=A0A9K3ITW1_HELAN|nr:hypothetical protein HanXRQr2_Chr06g0266431 [Helianthus annuus]KAJ0574087.1 hypothetical protein HanHA89_Chr06g0234201 [Helianthus annuus]KAJ0738422.1 hypothetical protein HanLR1_Chr06g0218131 [Helianthus annuus]KAJ0741310.1 hypothetical protein HanOQP8_Chr06g0226641 [Helianthus annuus]KAJ0912541.1 hypothetical protein HanRHA438_Chr06g0275501 [Helianthus annuus]